MRSTQDIKDDVYNLQQKLKNLKLFIVHAETELCEMNEMLMDIEEREFDKKWNEFYKSI